MSGLRHFKAEFLVRRFAPRLVHHTYGGHSLAVHLHDPMSADWYDFDWQMPPEFELLKASRLQPGALVFDAGGHQCVMAMLLAKEVGSSGRVVAIEPNPFNVRIARLNIETNGFKNVTTIEAMLSTTNDGGFVSFQLNAEVDPSQSYGRKVQSVTLGDLVSRFGLPAVIYLDIEGFEAEVVPAADELLQASIDWCVELHGNHVLRRYGSSNAKLVQLFLNCGFRIYVITNEIKLFEAKTMDSVPSERCHIVAVKSQQRSG
jgi:FkbM family methyltransferase